jgi:hypothetical protein
MSALGQKRTLEHLRALSALPPKADIAECDAALCQKRTFVERRTRRVTKPILGHSHDDVGLDFGRNLASSVPIRNHGRGMIGCSLQLVCISGFNLIA